MLSGEHKQSPANRRLFSYVFSHRIFFSTSSCAVDTWQIFPKMDPNMMPLLGWEKRGVKRKVLALAGAASAALLIVGASVTRSSPSELFAVPVGQTLRHFGGVGSEGYGTKDWDNTVNIDAIYHTYVYIYVHIYTYTYVHAYVYVCAYTYILYTHTTHHTHICVRVYIYIHLHMDACVCE